MQIQNPVLTGSLTLNGLNITTGNLVTTGSNVFVGNQTITGSVNITGSLNTTGSISLERGSLRIGDGVGGFSGFTFSSTLRQTNNNPVTLLGALRVDSTAGNTSYISGSGGLAIGKGTATAYLDISGSTLITGSLGVTGPITGSSILSTGQITAQTLVVSTISSSVTFSSGSNIFGNSTTNTQTMTGSVNITGSLTVTTAGTSPEFQVAVGGTTIGNALTDVHNVTGSLRITGSAVGVGNACFTSVCSPSYIGGTFSGTTISGTTLYGSTAVCSPTILGTTVVSGSVGCFVSTCSPTYTGGTFSGTTLYGSTVVCGASMCTTGNTCFGGMTIVANCLGIGTSTPGYKLEVIYSQNSAGTIGTRNSCAGTAAVAGLQIGNDVSSNAGGIAVFSSVYTPANAYPVNGTYIYNNRSGGIAIVSECATAPLYFGTCNVERMRITSAGCVGINANSPCRLLDVRGTVNLSTTTPGVASTAGAYADIHLRTYGPTPSSPARITVVDNWMDFVTTYTDGFRWYNYTSDGVTAERMRLTTGGNLTIGDRTPEGRLHLFGCVNGYGANLVLTNWCTATGVSTGIDFGVDESTSGCSTGNAQIKVCNIGTGVGGGANAADIIFSTYNGSTFGERLRISCNGNIGIGTTNPLQALAISGNTYAGNLSATLNFSGGGNSRFLELGALSGGDALLVTHASGYGVGYFGYEATGDRLVIATDNGGGANKIDFIVNAGTTTGGGTNNLAGVAAAMRITAAGVVCIASTTCTLGGIRYGNGSTTLNYYEEGSWTPVLQGSSVAGSTTYAFRSASYVRIGNYVYVRWGFKLSSIAGASGVMRITGLPFTAVNWGSYQEPNVSVSTGLLATADYAQRARVYVEGGGSALQGRIANNSDTGWDISEFGGDEWVIGEIFYNV